MAAFNYDDFGDRSDMGGTLTTVLNWSGAALSVLLIVGLATWGWQLWQRDVTGIPVVRALEGPMRVAPEDPGGQTTEFQGLAVNRIAEERAAEVAAVDRVVLAPQPTVLDEDEDLAMAELAPVVPAEPELETLPPEDEALVQVDPAPTLTVRPFPQVTVEEDTPRESSIRIIAAPTTPLSDTDLAVAAALGADTDVETVIEPEAAEVVFPATVPVTTPRPELRPSNIQRVSAPAVDPASGEIVASTVPAGTRLVQLGAFGSAETAREEWNKAQARFGNYMAGKERIIQQAQTGGRDFYRLRAMGFANLSEARRFCAVLVSDGANCIPVVQE